MLFGDYVKFKINNWQPSSNRIEREYDSEIVEYRSYNENKTVRLKLRGLKEKYSIILHDWTASDITFLNSIETSAVKNICNFQPSLDADLVKQSYFEYYVDPFKKELRIELTPVFLLKNLDLPNATTYNDTAQIFGNTIKKGSLKLGGVTLPNRTVAKISVSYETKEKISITGKIHRGYYYQDGQVYKKIKFQGTVLDVNNDLYNSLKPLQGASQVPFNVLGFNYKTVAVLDFVRVLKNQWLINFNLEVQNEYEPISLSWFGFATTPSVQPNNSLTWIGEEII